MTADQYLNTLVEFERKEIDPHALRGFVLGTSDDLTLLQVVTDDFALNGYTVLRNSDVTGYTVYDSPDYFLTRALRLKRIKPGRRPRVDLRSWPALLATANEKFPLVTIHREAVSNEVCYIGRVSTLGPKTFILEEIDPVAEWVGRGRYRYSDLTRVEFGGGYEDALWRVAQEAGSAAHDEA
jgi:hypothetical protein